MDVFAIMSDSTSPIIVGLLGAFLLGLIYFVIREGLIWRQRSRELDELQEAADHLVSGMEITSANGTSVDPAYERKVRNAFAHTITLSYEHTDGTSSEVELDPTSVDSIERFLKAVREENALRGRQGEPAAPAQWR